MARVLIFILSSSLYSFTITGASNAQQVQAKAPNKLTQPTGTHRDTERALLPSQEVPAPLTSTSAEKNSKERTIEKGWDWTVVASVTNAATSILLVFFGALGWHVVSRQLDEMKESNQTSREHHETLARPWMLALTIDGPKQIVHNNETTLSVYFTFKNTGATPAIIQSSVASWELSDRSQSERIVLAEQAAGKSGPAICPPGDFFHLPIHAHLPAGITLEMMSERRLILIVHGEVIYSDCFDKRRSTKFGMQYGRFFHDSDTPDWQACGEYNAIT